ncbi:GNAT family N-acetyltransferase [Nocardioides houyundeii]|uniref:GNAT family N-acetyltransferase n=1 Tax=Nocardioides houyundeii TaxID=2045452 RepID=UPI001F53C428|nr:GNAT family N-acetyltransferase [Nocardioides houyundeii]
MRVIIGHRQDAYVGDEDWDALLMEHLEVDGRRYVIDRAGADDVPAIADLLADDVLGAARESDDLAPYEDAFLEIDADPHQFLAVIRSEGGAIVGTMQLTTVPGLARGGAKRLLIEGVRLGSSVRGGGLGTTLLEWAHEYGRREGAVLAQLTSDKSRTDAHRFYERLGYAATHEGFKLTL